MSSNKKSLSVFGMTDSAHPIVMDIDPLNGKIKRFTELSIDEASVEAQNMLGYRLDWHKTFGAIYNDNQDSKDGNDYTYVSYVQDGLLVIVKILNTDSSAMKFDPISQKLVSSTQRSQLNATSLLREDEGAWRALKELLAEGVQALP